MPGPVPTHILEATERIAEGMARAESLRAARIGAEMERQHAAHEHIVRLMMALLWDNVALYTALHAIDDADRGWYWRLIDESRA
jgi:hypothetical protein